MEIEFRTKKLTKLANKFSKLQSQYGQNAKKIYLRLQQLEAADSLAIYEKLDPLARLHKLTGDRDGQYAVDVSGNCRLIFEIANNPIPRKEGEREVARDRVTKIKVLELSEDYHG